MRKLKLYLFESEWFGGNNEAEAEIANESLLPHPAADEKCAKTFKIGNKTIGMENARKGNK